MNVLFKMAFSPSRKTRLLFVPIECRKRFLTSNEAAAALRPFYFSVHPDLFGQFPKEREINEESLKHLQSYLESMEQREPIRPVSISFYLRNLTVSSTIATTVPAGVFRKVSFTLEKDLRSTVKEILETSGLSIDYLNSIPEAKKEPDRPIFWHQHFYADISFEDPPPKPRPADTLSAWLTKNYPHMVVKLEITRPVREEANRLELELINQLGLGGILYKCGWGIMHYRGCLQSFHALANQYPECLKDLRNRTVVFERTTGVDLDGNIILSAEDVRHHWLALIKSVRTQDITLMKIPAIQQAVSQVLRNIKVSHRKFQPAILVDAYEGQLRKLCAALSDYYVKHGYPNSWPSSLENFKLVVESDASPLMLSPTGQFIVPASCPASLIVNFMTENLAEASRHLYKYENQKHLEYDLHLKCVQDLQLADLNKDDNITPERMISFCKKLLAHKNTVCDLMRGSHIYVTHYYSLLQGGEMCIPWNWDE